MGDELVLEGIDKAVTTKERRQVAPWGFDSELPYEMATLPPKLHDGIKLVSFAKEKASWYMSNALKIATAGTKKVDGIFVFNAKECVSDSKNHEVPPGLLDYEGTIGYYRNCQRCCLLQAQLSCWHICTIAIWFRVTGSRSNRYWFSGRGMRWKKRRGWTLKKCESIFEFFLRLEGKAVSRVWQLIRSGKRGERRVYRKRIREKVGQKMSTSGVVQRGVRSDGMQSGGLLRRLRGAWLRRLRSAWT